MALRIVRNMPLHFVLLLRPKQSRRVSSISREKEQPPHNRIVLRQCRRRNRRRASRDMRRRPMRTWLRAGGALLIGPILQPGAGGAGQRVTAIFGRYAARAGRHRRAPGAAYTGVVVFKGDPAKAPTNVRKHGIDFDEAARVVGDALSTTFPDDAHSSYEPRFVTIGRSGRGRLVVGVHVEQGDASRIISVRRATRCERQFYEAGQ